MFEALAAIPAAPREASVGTRSGGFEPAGRRRTTQRRRLRNAQATSGSRRPACGIGPKASLMLLLSTLLSARSGLDRVEPALAPQRSPNRPGRLKSAGRLLGWKRYYRRPARSARATRAEKRMAAFRIAVIEGDGIGKEVVPEGVRVLEAAAQSVRSRSALGSARLGLRSPRPLRPHDARERARPHRRPRRDLSRRDRLADGVGRRIAVDAVDADPARSFNNM